MTPRLSNLLGYPFLSALFTPQDEVVSPDIKRQIATLTTTLAIASMLQLPSSPVDNVRDYWAGQLTTAATLANYVNEVYPIDLDAVLNLVYGFWFERYQLVHGLGFTHFLDQTVVVKRRERLLNDIQNRASVYILGGKVEQLIARLKQVLEG